MIAEKTGSDTLLSQIIEMVKQASRSRVALQKLVDKIAPFFVPIVVLIALLTFFLWISFGPEPKMVYAFVNAIAVLIIACPCALGLAAPMSVMVGIGKGAQSGILIKNADVLEALNKVDVLIIDKTGTMIQGKPSVEKIVAIEGFEEKVVLHYLFSLNQFSEHPLAAAVVKDGVNKGVKAIELGHFEAISGMRVVGTIHSKKVALGNRKLTEKVEALIPKELQGKVREEQDLGKTMSYLTIDQKVVGYVVVFDALKKSSKQAIADLIDHGMGVIMMTGDNKNTAQAVVKQLNLSDFQAECLPEDKLLKIKELQKAGKIIALAGDGINDAPALAQANVGIAMGTGTDVAIESAQITLVKGDLNGILNAIKLSHAVMANIKQNLFFAFAYNSIGIPIAAGLLYTVFGWLLSPMIAAAAMSFSSVSVIANSLRLRKFKMKRSS